MKIEELKIKPIFINQLMYDGLKDEKLFLINNELKDFAKENEYFIIPLDEILSMKKYDYYDIAHTAPRGSKRIADKIFPFLLEYFRENDEIE